MSEKSPKPEQAKQASRRIVLDHYQQTTDLDRGRSRWKFLGIVLGAVALVTVIGSLFANFGCVNEWSAPAQVASVHSSWEKDCQVCHTPGLPLRADSFAVRTLVGFTDTRTERDAKCIACHAGPQHHAKQNPGDTPSCAACHIDHQGVNGDLLRFSDKQCTNCHAAIASHGGPANTWVDVTRFLGAVDEKSGEAVESGAHPNFRSLGHFRPTGNDPDPGNLRFNHALHLAPNPHLPRRDQKSVLPIDATKQDLEEMTKRFGRNGNIQMVCADCHAPELPLEEAQGKQLPSSGAHMLPISFERHCAVCHKLPLASLESKNIQEYPLSRSVPHGLTAGEMQAFFNGVSNELKGQGREVNAQPKLLLPGKPFGQSEASRAVANPAALADASRTFVSQKCKQCHAEKTEGSFDYLPTAVPQSWFRHARFDHSAHRAVNCAECHNIPQTVTTTEQPLPYLEKKTGDETLVFIKGKETCAECHAPRGMTLGAAGPAKGGARFDCAECHRYHAGDFSLPHGGSAEQLDRGVAEKARFTISQFQLGLRPKVVEPAQTPTEKPADGAQP